MSITDADRAEWARLAERGVPQTRIARMAGKSRHTIAKAVGPVDRPKRERRFLWVVPEWYDEVVKMARSLGLVNTHSEAAGEGSPGRLLDEIGAGRIICTRVE